VTLTGTGVPVVTPFDDGDLDTAALERIVDDLDEYVDFLVPCGSTGEAPALTDPERDRVIETVAGATDRPVLAGVGGESVRVTVDRTARASEAGADAALVVTPAYYGHDADALRAYYRAVADRSSLPVYCYSVPKFTRVALDAATLADLAAHPSIAGVKDSAGDLDRLTRTVRATPDEFSVLVGHGGVYAHGLAAGAAGGVLALANVVPRRAARIYERHGEGDRAGARDLNADLADLNRAVTAEFGVPGVKAAMAARGLPVGRPRAPLAPLDGADRERVERLVERATDG
jgi:4-hydroxy-tetrahydrodipicolinate synthase